MKAFPLFEPIALLSTEFTTSLSLALILCQTHSSTCIHNPLKSILISFFRLGLGLCSGFYQYRQWISIPSPALHTSLQRTNNFLEEHKSLCFSLINFSTNLSIPPDFRIFSSAPCFKRLQLRRETNFYDDTKPQAEQNYSDANLQYRTTWFMGMLTRNQGKKWKSTEERKEIGKGGIKERKINKTGNVRKT